MHYITGVQLLIHPADEVPIYRQIMRQITDAIAVGRLKAGEKLPSHRELSEQLVIAPLTVKKAYDELELAGFLETQRGRGTFVCARPPHPNLAQQRDQIRDQARKLLAQAYLAGMEYADVLALLEEAERSLQAATAPKESV
ncbi:MAG: GntR family transcriptional regulator [Candidatus Solibacter sp.]